MAAQAKPSRSFDSSVTATGSSGSLGASSFAGAAAGALPLGLYLHVPFCSSTCDFCAFYQQKPHKPSIDLYIEAVAAELAQTRAQIERGLPWLWQGEAGFRALEQQGVVGSHGSSHGDGYGSAGRSFTVFFGGGTPGLLAARDLARLCKLVNEALSGLGPILEWSVELAPATVQADKVKALLEHGVTRFSLGVQSFSEPLLDALGRQHSPKQVLAAYETLRRCGAGNVNCDLMFALPGQTREDWLADLEKMRQLGPEHISTYCLTFEEDTAMWVKLAKGRYKLDPEREAALYRETWEWLAAAGYAQYEVSNFAREGFRSRHNLGTWQMSRWRGIGPSAASQWGGWRFQNPADLQKWAQALLPDKFAASSGSPVTVSVVASACGSDAGADEAHEDEPHGGGAHGDDASVAVDTPNAALVANRSEMVNEPWPPAGTEQQVKLDNSLLAADALIFGLRCRDGVSRSGWLERFGGSAAAAASALPLAQLEALFTRFTAEGLLATADVAGDYWRLTDEGLLLADAVGGEILECFDADC